VLKLIKKRKKIPSILICGPWQPVCYKVWLSCSSMSTR